MSLIIFLGILECKNYKALNDSTRKLDVSNIEWSYYSDHDRYAQLVQSRVQTKKFFAII